MPNFDEIVGSNVAAYRQSQGMSQADLARAMAQQGHAFHQQTVQKLEKGLRPLRLEEALALADALDVHVAVLWDEDRRIDGNASVMAARADWQRALDGLEQAAADFADLRVRLSSTAKTFDGLADEQLLDDVRHAATLEAVDIVHNAVVRRDAVRDAENSMTPQLLSASYRPAEEV